MKLKVGDWVYLNPEYSSDSTRGIITAEKHEWSDNYNIIQWEDGTRGTVDLSLEIYNKYLLKV